MGRVEIEGHTLGQRHRHYNKILKDTKQAEEIDENHDDVYNLLQIDVASRNRDVDYILGLLKGNNMLFVSRAINQCPWLITDNQYAHIINPEYLHSKLFPWMMSKAASKLMLHIRLNLRNETRVESFFNYHEHVDLGTALKWLPYCSMPFMMTQVEKYKDNVNTSLLKRLCERNHNILKLCVAMNDYSVASKFNATLFLLNTHTDFYLDLVETHHKYEFPQFNSKYTKFIMKTCPQRIHKMFHKYAQNIDIPTFVKYVDPNKIRDFLLTQDKNEENDMRWINYNNIEHFIKRMPQEQRLQFIKEMFLQGSNQNKLYRSVTANGIYYTKLHNWCQFMPFDTALREIKEDMKNIIQADEKKDIFCSLIRIARHDLRNIEALLQYFNDDLNNASNYKSEILRNLCQRTNVSKYNTKCWNLLNNIFSSMNVNDYESRWLDNIIMYKVLNNEEIPESIIKRYDYSTSLKTYRNSMSSEEQSRLFVFFYNNLLKKIDEDFTNKAKFEDSKQLIESMLSLLNDWNKNLADYPNILNKIRDLIKVNQRGMYWVYDINKSWRKFMFEESVVICPSERTFINALKHDPSLLSRNEKEVSVLRCNDNVDLTHLLRKLKLYWPQSLCSEWAGAYKGRLKEPLGHKSLVRGLGTLLPLSDFLVIVKQYKPENGKIVWTGNDENILSLQKFIAKNMHFACPHPDPNAVLEYAKGDYLQFALPSVNAVFYNLSAVRYRAFIPQLLDAPVSLQKHGMRLAFSKMQSDDLHPIFINYWKKNKNISIRAVIFKLTYNSLCKEKKPEKVDQMWSLLSVFIDALNFEEDKTIYDLLAEVHKIPLKTRPFYLMKSYRFLKSFLPVSGVDRNKYEQKLNSLINEIERLFECMPSDFVADILKDYVRFAVNANQKTEEFIPNDIMPLLVSYLLFSKSEDVHVQRYEMTLSPILNDMVSDWAQNKQKNVMGRNFIRLLNGLNRHLKNVVIKNMAIPCTVYENIQRKLEESLSPLENYRILREWKFTVEFAKTLTDSNNLIERSQYEGQGDMLWDSVCEQAIPKYAKKCVELLEDDLRLFFTCIYEPFSKALSSVLHKLLTRKYGLQVLKHMLTEDVTQTYLVAITITLENCYLNSEEDEWLKALHQIISSHPSLEVKMHYYHQNKNLKHRI